MMLAAQRGAKFISHEALHEWARTGLLEMDTVLHRKDSDLVKFNSLIGSKPPFSGVTFELSSSYSFVGKDHIDKLRELIQRAGGTVLEDAAGTDVIILNRADQLVLLFQSILQNVNLFSVRGEHTTEEIVPSNPAAFGAFAAPQTPTRVSNRGLGRVEPLPVMGLGSGLHRRPVGAGQA
jgi:hypothetical protein